MPANYVLLEKISVGAAGASSVTFSSIPQTGYTDLKVVVSARSSAAVDGDSAVIRFNTDTTSGNYTGKRLLGTGSAASSSSTNTGLTITAAANNTASTFSNAEIYIPNYLGSTAKSVSIDSVGENNATIAYSTLGAMLWSGTAAINKITLTLETGPNFAQYSTFYLYGVAKLGTTPVIVPYATGGDTIMTDGTYWYHTFVSSGTFTPTKNLTCDVLVVAGGGGGGKDGAGGGGAGGLLAFTSQALASGVGKTVTIGAGGAGSTDHALSGVNGTSSTFGSLTTAIGGGGGSSSYGGVGSNGGSGGGAGFNPSSVDAGGTGSQGSNGGSGSFVDGGTFHGGGGGGYSVAGSNGSGNTGGNGGNGSSAYSSWLSATGTGQNVSSTYWIAGGGGGGTYSDSTYHGTTGTGGNGGGAAGGNGNAVAGSNGTANTGGGGGGGSGGNGAGGNGGSGLVIVRYAI